MKTTVINRLREPSTWAGLSALAMLFGAPPGTMDVLAQAGVALAGVAAVLLPEKGAPIYDRSKPARHARKPA